MSENSTKRTVIEGTVIPLRGEDIDTDRIIPARYLKCVTFDGLGEYAFFDERFDENNNPKDHPFNDETYLKSNILVVNKNFGCGSSREHAPQSLMRFGIDVIVGESFAEIFAGNCTTLGIPTLTGTEESISKLMDYIEKNPDTVIKVDVAGKSVQFGENEIKVDIPESSRMVLIEGTWDSTAILLKNKPDIEAAASRLPYLNWQD